jgi:hypothetical protein
MFVRLEFAFKIYMHRHEFVLYPTNSHHEFNLKGSNNSYTFNTLVHIKYIMI